MKLLIVANYAKEHINKFHLSTIKKFKDQGWQVDVACHVDEPIPFCDNAYDLPCSRNPFNIGMLRSVGRLKDLIMANKYDVVHCHTLCGRLIGALAFLKLHNSKPKLFFSLHGLNYYKGSSLLSKLIIPLDRFILKKADLVFSVNNEDLSFLRKKGMISCKAIYCPITIKYDKFINKKDDFDLVLKTREALKVDNSIVLTYVAELNKNKNQIMLLKVLKLIKKTGRNYKLLLVGPDHSNGKLFKLAKKYRLDKDVMFLGWRDDINNLLISSDIYVASSIREGFGINIVEAMYCGIPVVATDNRGHREIINDNENGFLVKLNDIKTFSKRIEELADDEEKRKRIITSADRVLKDKFNYKCEDLIYQSFLDYFSEQND